MKWQQEYFEVFSTCVIGGLLHESDWIN